MRCKRWWIALLSFLLGGLALGCTRSAVHKKQPPDPLLWSKRSVAGNSQGDDTHKTARLDTPSMDPTLAALAEPAPLMPSHVPVTPMLADRASVRLLSPNGDGQGP